jgi:hypothetical protein
MFPVFDMCGTRILHTHLGTGAVQHYRYREYLYINQCVLNKNN